MTNEWRKPEPGDHRSPCPGLNALANGGHIPHSGKATLGELVTGMNTALGITRFAAERIARVAMDKLGKIGPNGEEVLTISDLALHGFLEHDASLTRRDAHKGDAVEVLRPLVDQLVALSQDGKTLTLEDIAVAHQLRMAQSAAEGHAVPAKAGVIGTLEAALLFLVLARDGVIAIPDLVELLAEERIPAHLTPQEIGLTRLSAAMAQIAVTGNVPGCAAAKRAETAIRDVIEPEASRCPVAHG